MPRKRKSVKKENELFSFSKDFLSGIRWDESYVSLIVGVIVVILVGILGIVFIRNTRDTQTSSTKFQPSVEFEKLEENGNSITEGGGKSYTVKEGDTLWSISERYYKSGYNWVDVAKANNLSNPDLIAAGNKLNIPDVQPKQITVVSSQAPKRDISGNSYKVQKGDYLWDIALRAYGDGYSWVKIAKANNLKNPDLIYSGNVLKIPR